MINVFVKYQDNHIKEVSINGHATFDEYGKDIVCAAVSTLVTASVNHILSLENSIDAIYQDEKLVITIKEVTDINQSILNTTLDMLEDIEYDYHQNIIIKEE